MRTLAWAAEVPDCEGQSIVPFGELWSASGLGYGMSAGGAAARLLYTISFHQICLFFLISFAFVAWAWVIVDRGGLVILNRVLLLSGLRSISQLLLCQVQKSRIGHSDSDCGVLQKVDVKSGEHILTRLSNVQYREKNVNRWGHRNRLYYTLNNRTAPKKRKGLIQSWRLFPKVKWPPSLTIIPMIEHEPLSSSFWISLTFWICASLLLVAVVIYLSTWEVVARIRTDGRNGRFILLLMSREKVV